MSKPKPLFPRKSKSFVKRQGRLTRGQARALAELWLLYGLNSHDGMLNITQPTVLEIGFGNGQSLLQMAIEQPETQFIGIEVHRPGVGALLLDIAANEVKNIRLYQEDAEIILAQCIPDYSLTRVQIYFPDPWPKKRHHKRRLVQAEFVQVIREKLQSNGILHLATDWQDYAEQMLQVMEQASGFVNMSGAGQYSPRPTFRPQTKFEARGLALGHGVWDLLYKKQ